MKATDREQQGTLGCPGQFEVLKHKTVDQRISDLTPEIKKKSSQMHLGLHKDQHATVTRYTTS